MKRIVFLIFIFYSSSGYSELISKVWSGTVIGEPASSPLESCRLQGFDKVLGCSRRSHITPTIKCSCECNNNPGVSCGGVTENYCPYGALSVHTGDGNFYCTDGNHDSNHQPDSDCESLVGEPIDLSTGQMFHEFELITINSRFPLEVSYSYEYKKEGKWKIGEQRRLEVVDSAESRNLRMHRNNRSILNFVSDGSINEQIDLWSSYGDTPFSITQLANGFEAKNRQTSETEYYDNNGNLIKVTNLHGYSHTYTYNYQDDELFSYAVMDESSNRAVVFMLDDRGRVSSIQVEGEGEPYTFLYGDRMLVSVTGPGADMSFDYAFDGDPTALTSATGIAGKKQLNWDYDAETFLATHSSVGDQHQAYNISYETEGGMIQGASVQYGKGDAIASSEYSFQADQWSGVRRLENVVGEPVGSCAKRGKAFVRDSNGFVVQQIDVNNHAVKTTRSSAGKIKEKATGLREQEGGQDTLEMNADSLLSLTTWHEAAPLPIETVFYQRTISDDGGTGIDDWEPYNNYVRTDFCWTAYRKIEYDYDDRSHNCDGDSDRRSFRRCAFRDTDLSTGEVRELAYEYKVDDQTRNIVEESRWNPQITNSRTRKTYYKNRLDSNYGMLKTIDFGFDGENYNKSIQFGDYTPRGFSRSVIYPDMTYKTLSYTDTNRVNRVIYSGSDDSVLGVIEYNYNDAGNIEETTLLSSDQSVFYFEKYYYDDSGNIIGLLNSHNEYIGYEVSPGVDSWHAKYICDYDVANKACIDVPQFVNRRTFDRLGRLSGIEDFSGNLKMTFGYDEGGQHSTTLFHGESRGGESTDNKAWHDDDDIASYYEYNSLNQLVSVAGPGACEAAQCNLTATNNLVSSDVGALKEQSPTTYYEYSPHGKVSRYIDPNGNITLYSYNAFGELFEKISPVTGTTRYAYNGAGWLVSRVLTVGEASERTVQYRYDNLGRLIVVENLDDGGVPILYRYDAVGVADGFDHGNGVGRLTRVIDEQGQTRYGYDDHGRLIRVERSLDGILYLTQYSYDQYGNLTRIIYPDGYVLNYIHEGVRLHAITAQKSLAEPAQLLVSNIDYHSNGSYLSFDYGNGLHKLVKFDPDEKITSIFVDGSVILMDRNYNYDYYGNIFSVDSYFNNESFDYAYDTQMRLYKVSGMLGYSSHDSMHMDYDKISNRNYVKIYDRDGIKRVHDQYIYDEQSTYLGGVLDLLDNRTTDINYDDHGNAIDIHSGNEGDYLKYGPDNRLKKVIRSENGFIETIGEYGYDFSGKRVKKSARSPYYQTIHYHYDQNERLISESTDRGIFLRHYVYLFDELVAILVPDDLDNDQINDGWEIEHFGSITIINGFSDSDQDGIKDIQEFFDNTDPKDPRSGSKGDRDSDRDGMIDLWEINHGGSINKMSEYSDDDIKLPVSNDYKGINSSVEVQN